jgi:hypothetical protein
MTAKRDSRCISRGHRREACDPVSGNHAPITMLDPRMSIGKIRVRMREASKLAIPSGSHIAGRLFNPSITGHMDCERGQNIPTRSTDTKSANVATHSAPRAFHTRTSRSPRFLSVERWVPTC